MTRVAAWASCGLVMAAGWVWLVASGLVVAVPEACAFHRATRLKALRHLPLPRGDLRQPIRMLRECGLRLPLHAGHRGLFR